MSQPRNDLGFSLVEALVALGVFAMAGVALVQLQTHSLTTFTAVERRALADVAAQNKLTQIIAAQTRPGVGAREEEIAFAGRTWRMTTTVSSTTDARTRRVSVAVQTPGAAGPDAVAHGFFVARAGAQ